MATIAERPRGAAVAWALALLAALAGYLWIVLPANREVSGARALVRVLDERAEREEDAVRRAAASRTSKVFQTLPRSVLVHRTRAQAMLAALQSFAHSATRRHVTIASFAPSDAVARGHTGGQAVTVTLRGSYGAVLETVAELSSGAVLFDVGDTTITQTSSQTDWDGVDATVDGVLFASPSDVSASHKENQRVAASSSVALNVSRNPFDVRPELQVPASPAGPALSALPPNAGAGVPVLRAVIDGEPPRALVEIGDRPSIVRVGSHLGFATVTAISANEVRLDDGRVIRITGTPR